MKEGALDSWMQFFKTILDLNDPSNVLEGETENTDEIERRDKTIYWKIKGLVAKITFKLFIKYGDN